MKRFRDYDDNTFNDFLDVITTLNNFVMEHKNSLPKYDGISLEHLIPTIVVVGNQSSGKSSLLSSLTKKRLPVSASQSTLFATEIRFRRRETESAYVSVHNQMVECGRKELTEETIIEAHNHIVKNLSSNIDPNIRIIVEISGPDYDSMTFVDIPGFFAFKGGDDRSHHVPIDIANNYMRMSNCLIVQVFAANTDIETSISNAYVKQHDPTGLRTVNVFTKMDRVEGKTEFLQRVKNFDPKAILTVSSYLIDGEVKEVDEFKERAILAEFSFDYRGRNVITKRMSEHTQHILKKNESEICAGIKSLMSKIMFNLQTIGSSPEEPRFIHHKWIKLTDEIIKSLREDSSSDLNKSIFNFKNDLLYKMGKTKGDGFFRANEIEILLQQEMTSEIPFVDGNRKIISSLIKKMVEHCQDEIFETIDSSLSLFDDVFTSIVSSTGEICQVAARNISKVIKDGIEDNIDTFKEQMKDNLSDIYQNLSILNMKEILVKMEELRTAASLQAIILLQQGNIDAALQILKKDIKPDSYYTKRAEIISSICKTYWETRINEIKNSIFRWINMEMKKVLESYSDKVSQFRDDSLLCENNEIVNKRKIYLDCDRLLKNVLHHFD